MILLVRTGFNRSRKLRLEASRPEVTRIPKCNPVTAQFIDIDQAISLSSISNKILNNAIGRYRVSRSANTVPRAIEVAV